MNDLDHKKNCIAAYWRRRRNKEIRLNQVEFERRVESMKHDLDPQTVEEMYAELPNSEKESVDNGGRT